MAVGKGRTHLREGDGVVEPSGGVAGVDLRAVVVLAHDDLCRTPESASCSVKGATCRVEDARVRSGENEWAVKGPVVRWKLKGRAEDVSRRTSKLDWRRERYAHFGG